MWQDRLSAVLSRPFELVSLESAGDEPFGGRYLRLGKAVFGIGRLIASGGEALVYELIDLDASILVGVAKVCRFRPGSPEYRKWAVPIRFEGNAHSELAEVELQPARLVQVPGGWIKLQDYVSVEPDEDWMTVVPARAIYANGLSLEERLKVADDLIEARGRHGVLLEARGIILAELERDEEAVAALEEATDLFREESHAGVLRVAPLLASCHRRLYQLVRWKDAAVVMTLPGVGSQIIYSDPEASARDDTLEDRSLYVVLEALDVEPYSIPNLAALAEHLLGSWISVGEVEKVLDAMDRVSPGHRITSEIRGTIAAMEKERANAFERLAARATLQENSSGEETADTTENSDLSSPGEEATPPTAFVDADRGDYRARFERAYKPEPSRGQIVEGRVNSAYANLASGRFEQAEAAARGALEMDRTHVGANLALSRVLYQTGRVDEAEAVLVNACKILPFEGDLYAELGFLQMQESRFEEARTSLQRSLISEPKNTWDVRFSLGRVCRKLGNRIEALRWLRKCVAEAPDRASATIELAYALRSQPEPQVEEALEVIDRALVYTPKDAELLVCRSQLLGMKGEWAEAIALLESVVASNADHPIAAKFLAALRDPSGGIND